MEYQEFMKRVLGMEILGESEKLKDIDFVADGNLQFEELSNVRRPHFRCRGKKLSREQAMLLLKQTDFSVIELVNRLKGESFAKANVDWLLDNSWFTGNSWQTGWVWPDGTVGTDSCYGAKYPEPDEIVCPFIGLIANYPFLDAVWAFTNWNERSPKYWEEETFSLECDYSTLMYRKQRQALTDEEQAQLADIKQRLGSPYIDEGFEDSIILGVWVHDGKLELLNAERTREVYVKYDKEYSCKNPETYNCTYYSTEGVECEYITLDLLRELLAMWDLSEEEVNTCVKMCLKSGRVKLAGYKSEE